MLLHYTGNMKYCYGAHNVLSLLSGDVSTVSPRPVVPLHSPGQEVSGDECWSYAPISSKDRLKTPKSVYIRGSHDVQMCVLHNALTRHPGFPIVHHSNLMCRTTHLLLVLFADFRSSPSLFGTVA